MAVLHNAAVCQRGQVRSVNQDAILCLSKGDEGLYLVADGMGDGYHGERASALIRQAYQEWWVERRATSVPSSFVDALDELQSVLISCSESIARITPPGMICGSTIVLLWSKQESYAILSIGDSRAYSLRLRWSKVDLFRLTSDDVARAEDGWPVKELGRLTRYVGGTERHRGALRTGIWASGEIILLCSDGIYKACPESFWGKLLGPALRQKNLEWAVRRLSNQVFQMGAQDNFSLVLVRQER